MTYDATNFAHRIALASELRVALEKAGFSIVMDSGKEIVMRRQIASFCELRVYTGCSFNKHGVWEARDEGDDAIRVCAVDTERKKGYIKLPRVTRGARSSIERIVERTMDRARVCWTEARKRAVQQGRA